MHNILICDDDKEIVEALSIYLKQDGYNVYETYNGFDAKEIVKNNHIDLIIMDIMMPGEDGYKVTQDIRKEHTTPIIFLSAKEEVNDKILGFNVGADDFITKPFNPLLLLARIKVLLRRDEISNTSNEKIFTHNNLVLDDDKKQVTLNDDIIKLTPIEYNLLLYFLKNKGKTIPTKEIYKEVWNTEYAEDINNTVAVHIRHLREKIEQDTKEPNHIKVLWGIGYRMEN